MLAKESRQNRLPGLEKRITKARKNENTKKHDGNAALPVFSSFRAFVILFIGADTIRQLILARILDDRGHFHSHARTPSCSRMNNSFPAMARWPHVATWAILRVSIRSNFSEVARIRRKSPVSSSARIRSF